MVNKYSLLLEAYKVLKELVFLNSCELEGMQSGQPSPEQWREAFEEAERVIEKMEK